MIGKRFVSLSTLTLALLSVLLTVTLPAHAQTETALYNFIGGTNGSVSGLTSDGAGNFYGTTFGGGVYGSGTVFELSPNGSGGWNETVLYNFTGGADGSSPESPVIMDSAGNIYGTTIYGGAPGCYTGASCGVVFELSPAGGSWTETVLYAFPNDEAEGFWPVGGLIMDSAGNLYGTTTFGGSNGLKGGTVFELSPSGGTWTYQLLYSPVSTSGYGIFAGLTMDSSGNLFGATWTTVFELSPDGEGGWNLTVLHTFIGGSKDGYAANGTPVLDKAGNLYVTTLLGGAKNVGTVDKLSYSKKKGWTGKILRSFKGGKKDGNGPRAGIVFDVAGNIYGTTTGGGTSGYGTVFELVAPKYKEKVLWSFNGTDGAVPYGGLILDTSSNLYGTTQLGGSYGNGVVFEVTP